MIITSRGVQVSTNELQWFYSSNGERSDGASQAMLDAIWREVCRGYHLNVSPATILHKVREILGTAGGPSDDGQSTDRGYYANAADHPGNQVVVQAYV